MNKKILALAMIPLLIGLSGAMAFSQFTGTDSKAITATAGTFSMTEGAAVSSYYVSSGSMMTVGGPVEDGHAAVTWTPSSDSGKLGTSTLAVGESSMTYDITVSNIAPGEWVNVTFTLTNTGSLAITLLPGMLTSAQSSGVGGAALGAITNDSASSTSFVNGVALSGSGWAYSVFGLYPTSPTVLTPTGASSVTTFTVSIGLGDSASNSYETSSFTVAVSISLSAE
ncbi:MAG: hypothetical protein KIS30_03175 [Thermoplasmata archaeon]|nr:hypothetical protein [Candidatus Sysuiplasma acidicola]MBX8645746.1 hypothetical protein [Candidatus Sysuiplasma acidicola]